MKKMNKDQSGGLYPNKKKKKDHQLQKQDSKTNRKQIYGGNFSGFDADIPSKRNKTTGAPFQESDEDTFQNAPFQCIKIFKDLAFGEEEAENKNFVFSPCSIQLALSLLANGAKGPTLDELLEFLEAKDMNHLNSVASKFVSKLSGFNTKRGPTLSLVSGVWVDHSKPLNPTFVSVAKSIYRGEAEAVDFRKAEEVLDKVNKWAEEATQGLIKPVLPEGSFNYTSFVLANALYFKGKWDQNFRKSHTKYFEFYLLNGKSVEVPFMTNNKRQFVRSFDNFKVLRLPYKTSIDEYATSLSMYIILPNKRDGLLPLTQMVCSDPLFFKKYVHDSYPKHVRMGSFWIPKFKITHVFDCKNILQDVELKLTFSDEAEFDNLFLNLGESLKVSKVIHKSYIEVNEEGTAAAAVTLMYGCEALGPLPPPPPPVNFVADHPFMFVIRDDKSGMVLFMGQLVNPLME